MFDAACVEGPADLQYLIMRTIPLAEAFPLTSVTWRDESATTLPKLLRPEEALGVWVHMGLSRELTAMAAAQHVALMMSLLDRQPRELYARASPNWRAHQIERRTPGT